LTQLSISISYVLKLCFERRFITGSAAIIALPYFNEIGLTRAD
jgi:hypothetical protein